MLAMFCNWYLSETTWATPVSGWNFSQRWSEAVRVNGVITTVTQQHQLIVVTSVAHFTEILVGLLSHTHRHISEALVHWHSMLSHTHRHISEALVHWHSIHIHIQNQQCLTFSTFRLIDLNARYQCPYLLTNFDLRTNFISCHWTSLPCWQLGVVLLPKSYQWPLILTYSVNPVSLELLPFHFVAAIPIVEPVVEKCFQFKFNFFLRCNDLCFFLLQ